MKKNKFSNAEEYIKLFKQASQAYYNSDAPILSDEEYDILMDEFTLTYPDHEFLKTVGSPVITDSRFTKVKHEQQMGSLTKIKTIEELNFWWDKNALNELLIWSLKLDGLSVSLKYKKGKLIQAVSRGDGEVGEDITQNVLQMKIAKHLPLAIDVTIRGEIILAKKLFKEHFSDKKSPRNVAAGIVRRLDGEGAEHLEILVYDIISSEKTFSSEIEKFEFLEKELGLKVPTWGKVKTPADVYQIWLDYENGKRDKSDFEMDGLVVTINNCLLQQDLGFVDNRPKFARAYKFTSQSQESEIEDVLFFVGRTGRITPVAKIKPIFIAGAQISNVTLHNLGEIKRLGLKIGQKVLVVRSGDVIPKIVSVLDQNGKNIVFPKFCPSCKSALSETDIFVWCYNKECPDQILQGLIHWVSVLDLKGLGEEVVQKLMTTGKVKDPSDFYKLNIKDISSLDRLGEKSATKLLNEIKSKNKIELPLFIKALGIEGVGSSLVEKVMTKYPTLDAMLTIKETYEIIKIKGIAESTATSFIEGLKEKRDIIKKLLPYITIKEEQVVGGPLEGKTFCFTGFRDKELESTIKNKGGKILNSVTKELNYLVTEDKDSTSGKIEKAKKSGVLILNVEELLNLIG